LFALKNIKSMALVEQNLVGKSMLLKSKEERKEE
jgi:hypothetical protein